MTHYETFSRFIPLLLLILKFVSEGIWWNFYNTYVPGGIQNTAVKQKQQQVEKNSEQYVITNFLSR